MQEFKTQYSRSSKKEIRKNKETGCSVAPNMSTTTLDKTPDKRGLYTKERVGNQRTSDMPMCFGSSTR